MEQMERNLHALSVGQMLLLDGLLLIVMLLATYAAARYVRRPRGRFAAVLLWWVTVVVLAPFYYAFARWTLAEYSEWQARASAHTLNWLAYPGLILASAVWGALALKGRAAWLVDVAPYATASFRTAQRQNACGRTVVSKRNRRYTLRSYAPPLHRRPQSSTKQVQPART